MFRFTRSLLLACAFLAFASSARAESLQLLAPAAGATLRGGSSAELYWSAKELPATAEEWEAFLSIDGGKYYAFRVTPHLDIELRRFTFVVPNVDTRYARILIRTGNEETETHFESSVQFSIVRDAGAKPLAPQLLQNGHAEAAREGDAAVLAWADGARNGSGLTQQSAPPAAAPSGDHLNAADGDSATALAPAQNCVREPSIATTRRAVSPPRATTAEPLTRAVDLLLVCRRRNI